MDSFTKANRKSTNGRLERAWTKSEPGLVLMDSLFRPVAFNAEAAAILSYPERPGADGHTKLRIPEEVLDSLRRQSPSSFSITYFRAGKRKYACQASVMESCNGSADSLVALLIQRHSSTPEAIHEIAAQYNLTERERETLNGISLGLTSKELAEQMAISPNTVKAYLHLIMVKMGVTTRAAVLAKILEHNPGFNKVSSIETNRHEMAIGV